MLDHDHFYAAMLRNTRAQRLIAALQPCEHYRQAFAQFCKIGQQALNGDERLRTVSFEVDGAIARLRFLDQRFTIRHHVVALDETVHIGVLAVYSHAPDDKETLFWRTFFDRHGNVKDAPKLQGSSIEIADAGFLIRLLGEVSERYFSQSMQTFGIPAG